MRFSLRLTVLLSGLMLSNLWHIAAQRDALMSQYFYAPVNYNAGAAGYTDAFNITAAGQIHAGSDKYALLNADMPFSIGGTHRIGAGIMADYTNTAIFRNLKISLPLAWKFTLESSEISVGIAPGVTNSTLKTEQAITEDITQESVISNSPTDKHHKTRFNIGGGVWYNSKSFRTGLSFTHSGSQKLKNKTDTPSYIAGVTAYYFIAAGNIPVKSSLLDIEPSVIAVLSSGKLNGQATARAIWKRCLWFGAGYRLHENTVFMAGIEIKGFRAGYSFLMPHTSNSHSLRAGHEVTAGYSIALDLTPKNKPRHKSVRLM
ncbi:MAG: PorP/SprF family type IX secretion system membrane protein [Muribaculaceae bacterium]|nr:PorP/SprF family type IX secretion system membrane protein [Muribaculaceae bacterium]